MKKMLKMITMLSLFLTPLFALADNPPHGECGHEYDPDNCDQCSDTMSTDLTD